VKDGANNAMTANNVFDFFVFAGDANHDRSVNTTDFSSLAANFGQSGKNYSQGNFNYDGVVDTLDFAILASRYGESLAAPGASPLAAAARSLPLFGSSTIAPADPTLLDDLI